LGNTLEQLSSGSRINSGADDAAGLAIANGLNANGSRLLLESNTSGTPGNLTISSDTTGLGFTQNPDQVGTNASITVDGIPIGSTSNEVSGAIPGVTLEQLPLLLQEVTAQIGWPISSGV